MTPSSIKYPFNPTVVVQHLHQVQSSSRRNSRYWISLNCCRWPSWNPACPTVAAQHFVVKGGPFTSWLAIVVCLSSILGFPHINIGKVVATLGTSAMVQTKSLHSNLACKSQHCQRTLICTQIAALSSTRKWQHSHRILIAIVSQVQLPFMGFFHLGSYHHVGITVASYLFCAPQDT